jgi:hypothetical protein
MNVMDVLGGIAAGAIAGACAMLWSKNKARVEPAAEKAGEWIENKFGFHTPDGVASFLKWLVRTAVQGLDVAFSSKDFWRFAYNKVRHEQGDLVADEFRKRMESVDWGKALADQCPPEFVELYNQARQAAAEAHVKAQVDLEAKVNPDHPEIQKLQAAVSNGALTPMIKACVAAQKTEAMVQAPAILNRPKSIQAEIEKLREGLPK